MPVKHAFTPQMSRFVVGVPLAALAAFCSNWPIAYVTPVFVVLFLTQPFADFRFKHALLIVASIGGSLAISFIFSVLLFPYPPVFVPAQGLALFLSYYALNRGVPIFGLLMLFSITLLPLQCTAGSALPEIILTHFTFGAVVATIICMFVWWLFPTPSIPVQEKREDSPPPSTSIPAVLALKSTVAILPLSTLFISMQWSSEALVLIFASIFSMSPQMVSGKAAGTKSLISTLLGGAGAAAFYFLLTTSPTLPFFAALLVLAALICGKYTFADGNWTRYMPSAATCFFILLGGILKPDADFESAFVRRMLFITASTLYVVFAFTVLERFFPSPKSHTT